MGIGNGAPAWPSVIVSNGGISPSDHIPFGTKTRNSTVACTMSCTAKRLCLPSANGLGCYSRVHRRSLLTSFLDGSVCLLS